jgi:topoisomerase-4 subunit B
MRRAFKAGSKVEVSRFKGLGEMPPAQLKETTMDPSKRTLLKVMAIAEQRAETNELVESLMGRRPELRFAFIQERAKTVQEVDV